VKTLPKSLHTVTVLVNVARFINKPHLNPGLSPELALDKALELLGYGGTLLASEDPHGLQAKALRILKGARA
jgi:hypothetical protein